VTGRETGPDGQRTGQPDRHFGRVRHPAGRRTRPGGPVAENTLGVTHSADGQVQVIAELIVQFVGRPHGPRRQPDLERRLRSIGQPRVRPPDERAWVLSREPVQDGPHIGPGCHAA